MPLYQNYSIPQPMINPNPMYPQQMPMQNMYMDRMGQLQQYQQSLQQPVQQPMANVPGLVGRAVNDFSEIKADDVPMNGTPAIFIKNDMSEIEVRVWCKDGLIRPTSYKPIIEQIQPDGTNIPPIDFNALNEDVRVLREEISQRFDRLEKSMGSVTAKTTASKAKKEAASDE